MLVYICSRMVSFRDKVWVTQFVFLSNGIFCVKSTGGGGGGFLKPNTHNVQTYNIIFNYKKNNLPAQQTKYSNLVRQPEKKK